MTRLEAWVRVEQGLVGSRSLFDVGLHEAFAVIDQDARHFADPVRGDDETFLVTLFPPGIRKMNEHPSHTARSKTRERLTRIAGKNTASFCVAPRAQTIIHDLRPFPSDLQGDDVGGGVRLETFEQESAPRGADLQLDWIARPKESARIDDRVIREIRSIRIGIGTIHAN